MANLGYIQVTRQCNQHCRFCSNPERMITLSIEEAVERVNDLADRNYFGVIFTGGEPTLMDHLPEAIAHAKSRGVQARLITNGQKTADYEYFKTLVEAGLDHINVSTHSYRDSVQAFLTENPDSLKNITRTLENSGMLDISTDINTVINHYNADHLDSTVRWVVKNFPHVRHFVWNNIDPRMNRASQNRDTVPGLQEFEIPLYKACKFLEATDRTFRVERVPLCYMADFAHCSTETRKIIKMEERIVHFLDEKQFVRQTDWLHGKTDCCKSCLLDSICAGLYEIDTYYDSKELYPVFIRKETIINKVKPTIDQDDD